VFRIHDKLVYFLQKCSKLDVFSNSLYHVFFSNQGFYALLKNSRGLSHIYLWLLIVNIMITLTLKKLRFKTFTLIGHKLERRKRRRFFFRINISYCRKKRILSGHNILLELMNTQFREFSKICSEYKTN